jgi:hypothetical protein
VKKPPRSHWSPAELDHRARAIGSRFAELTGRGPRVGDAEVVARLALPLPALLTILQAAWLIAPGGIGGAWKLLRVAEAMHKAQHAALEPTTTTRRQQTGVP